MGIHNLEWVSQIKGLSRNNNNEKKKTLVDTDIRMVTTRRKRGWGREKRVKGR